MVDDLSNDGTFELYSSPVCVCESVLVFNIGDLLCAWKVFVPALRVLFACG